MTALTTPRARVRSAIVEQLVAHPALAGVQVDRQIPAEVATEHVLLSTVSGTFAYRTIKAARKQREDRFTIKVFFGAMRPGQSAEQAELRVLELFNALDDILANDATLSLPTVRQVGVGRVEGPDVQTSTEGHVAFIEADVEVVAFLI